MKIFFYVIVLSFLFSSNVFPTKFLLCYINTSTISKYVANDTFITRKRRKTCAVNKYGNVEFGAGGCAVNNMEMSSAQILRVAGVLSINMEMLSAIDITKSDNNSVTVDL